MSCNRVVKGLSSVTFVFSGTSNNCYRNGTRSDGNDPCYGSSVQGEVTVRGDRGPVLPPVPDPEDTPATPGLVRRRTRTSWGTSSGVVVDPGVPLLDRGMEGVTRRAPGIPR